MRWSAIVRVKSDFSVMRGAGGRCEQAERFYDCGELLIVGTDALLQFIELGRKRFLRAQPLPQADKRANNIHSHFDCRIAAQHVGRLDSAVFGEGVGQMLDMLASP